MVKVLHINDDSPRTGGGAEVMMSRTIALLRARGVVVETFTRDDLPVTSRTPLRYVDNRHARTALAAKLRAFRPSIIHLHNYYHILSPGILAVLQDYFQRWTGVAARLISCPGVHPTSLPRQRDESGRWV